MGSGITKILIKNGFLTTDLDQYRQCVACFNVMGGHAADSTGGFGQSNDSVFVMVTNGSQAREVIPRTGSDAQGPDHFNKCQNANWLAFAQ